MKKTILRSGIFLFLIMIAVVASAYMAAAQESNGPAQVVIYLLNQYPDVASAGGTADIKLQLQNIGGLPANNLHIQLLPEYPIDSVIGNDTQIVSVLPAYQADAYTTNLPFTVKIDSNAITGVYPLKIKYWYDLFGPLTTEINISVTNQQYAQIIYVDKALLEPGKETPLNFTINNVGNSPLQNLVFSWLEPTGVVLPIYSDNTKYIKKLDPGQSITVSYTVMAGVNAVPGLYKLNLNLNFQSAQNSTPTIITTQAGVFVGGETDFDVAFSESTQGQTSLSVSNIGNNPAQSVSIIVPNQNNFRVTGTNNAIIGNLNPGDYTLVSFQIASRFDNSSGTAAGTGSTGARAAGASSAASQRPAGQNAGQFPENFTRNPSGASGNVSNNPNNLQVIIQYTDTAGQRVSVQKSVSINFRSAGSTGQAASGTGRGSGSSSNFFTSSTFYIIIIVVLVIVIGYLIYKRNADNKRRK